MTLTVKTPSNDRVIDLEDVKQYCGIYVDEDDRLLDRILTASVNKTEAYLRRSLLTTVYELRRRGFENTMELWNPPLQSVDSIKYIDTDGNEQTLASSVYDEDTYKRVPEVRLAYDQSWPEVRDVEHNVTIEYTAGYASADEIPDEIVQAILMLCDHLYEHRGSVSELRLVETPMGWESLLYNHKIFRH